jgi:hypothetical protein
MAEYNLTPEEISNAIVAMPDEVLSHIAFSTTWQYNPDGVAEGGRTRDADGFPSTGTSAEDRSLDSFTRQQLQNECWNKFERNPQLNTAVRGLNNFRTNAGISSRGTPNSILPYEVLWAG